MVAQATSQDRFIDFLGQLDTIDNSARIVRRCRWVSINPAWLVTLTLAWGQMVTLNSRIVTDEIEPAAPRASSRCVLRCYGGSESAPNRP